MVIIQFNFHSTFFPLLKWVLLEMKKWKPQGVNSGEQDGCSKSFREQMHFPKERWFVVVVIGTWIDETQIDNFILLIANPYQFNWLRQLCKLIPRKFLKKSIRFSLHCGLLPQFRIIAVNRNLIHSYKSVYKSVLFCNQIKMRNAFLIQSWETGTLLIVILSNMKHPFTFEMTTAPVISYLLICLLPITISCEKPITCSLIADFKSPWLNSAYRDVVYKVFKSSIFGNL